MIGWKGMSSFDEERNVYKNKVGRQRDAIANLRELAEQHTGLFDFGMMKQLEVYQTKCEKLYKKINNNEFEIAIVGLEKAGKSTFGNALMENRILPDADERCTYTSTCIRYGQDRAIVSFFSNREMDDVLRGYLQTLGVENVDTYTYQTLSRGDYIALYEKLDQRDKDRYENTVHQDVLNLLDNKAEILSQYIGKPNRIFEGKDLYQEDFKAYIVSPKVAVAVKEVSIESSKLGKLQNAVIYDVPGFDSPTGMHLEQTKKRMKEADAIMLIASAEKPSFTAPALNMFQEVVDEDNVSLGDKLFVFGNRADAANTLAKNIQTLKKEAQKWKLLSGAQLDERLIIGSAKAHLQKLGIVSGDFCVKKIEEDEEYRKAWGHGDGIEYAYEKLVGYNETERFSVMKKKIQRNNEELFDIFKELKEKYANGSSAINYSAILAKTTLLKSRAREAIQKGLEELRFEIVKKYRDDLILSRRLQEEISKLFEDEEKYAITQNDIHNAELKIDDASGSINVEKVEENIREEKFKKIYGDFSESAFAVAQNDHTEYYTRIVDGFENALGIHKKTANYIKIHNAITDFIEKSKKNTEDEFIYQSIIERFVRDVVEVLIRRPYSSEARLNKFVDEAEVFSGLVMFYNSGDANEGYKKQFLSVAPKNQPLLLALVFHEYKQSDECSRNIMIDIGKICKSLCDHSEVVQLVFSIVKQDPIGGADAIRKMICKEPCKDCKSDEDFARKIIPTLRKVKMQIADEGINDNDHSTKKHDFDFTNKGIFERQYKQFFGNTEVRSYDNICEFFKVDLEILEKFLIHASIPAIRLEKPFVAREVQSINKLLETVASIEFDNLVDENAELLLPGICESINMAIENSFANKAAVAEVEKILKTLKDENVL